MSPSPNKRPEPLEVAQISEACFQGIIGNKYRREDQAWLLYAEALRGTGNLGSLKHCIKRIAEITVLDPKTDKVFFDLMSYLHERQNFIHIKEFDFREQRYVGDVNALSELMIEDHIVPNGIASFADRNELFEWTRSKGDAVFERFKESLLYTKLLTRPLEVCSVGELDEITHFLTVLFVALRFQIGDAAYDVVSGGTRDRIAGEPITAGQNVATNIFVQFLRRVEGECGKISSLKPAFKRLESFKVVDRQIVSTVPGFREGIDDARELFTKMKRYAFDVTVYEDLPRLVEFLAGMKEVREHAKRRPLPVLPSDDFRFNFTQPPSPHFKNGSLFCVDCDAGTNSISISVISPHRDESPVLSCVVHADDTVTASATTPLLKLSESMCGEVPAGFESALETLRSAARYGASQLYQLWVGHPRLVNEISRLPYAMIINRNDGWELHCRSEEIEVATELLGLSPSPSDLDMTRFHSALKFQALFRLLGSEIPQTAGEAPSRIVSLNAWLATHSLPFESFVGVLQRQFGVDFITDQGKGSHYALAREGYRYFVSKNVRSGKVSLYPHFIREILAALRIDQREFIQALE